MYSAIILDRIDRQVICSFVDCETEESAIASAKNELKKWMNPTDHVEVVTMNKGKIVEIVCDDGEALDIMAIVQAQKEKDVPTPSLLNKEIFALHHDLTSNKEKDHE